MLRLLRLSLKNLLTRFGRRSDCEWSLTVLSWYAKAFSIRKVTPKSTSRVEYRLTPFDNKFIKLIDEVDYLQMTLVSEQAAEI
jgi:hypothetical protein